MKRMITEWIEIVVGLLIFSFGIHLTIQAGIGVGPWDCLGMGVAKQTPLNYGVAMTTMSVIILIIDLVMKEHIGFGTIIDALSTGMFVNFFITHSPFHAHHLVTGILMMLIGIVIASVGQFFYMRAGQGCGPRDSFLIALGKRLRKISIGTVNIILLTAVFIAGFLLGGPVGVGTLISVFGTGVIMDLVFQALHFEPRNITHRDVLTTLREAQKS